MSRRAPPTALIFRIFLHHRPTLAQKLHLCDHVVNAVGSCQGGFGHRLILCHLWLLSPPSSFSWVDPIKRNSHASSYLPPAPKCLVIEPILEWFPTKSVHDCSSLFEVFSIVNRLVVPFIIAPRANVRFCILGPASIFPMTPLQAPRTGERSKLRARFRLVCWK